MPAFEMHKLIKACMRSTTFSLRINKLATFSEITQAWQCIMIVLIQSNMFTY